MKENKTNKKIIQIGLEFVFGPLLRDEVSADGSDSTGVSLVDNDSEINNIDKQANDLWYSLWKNDSKSPSGMKFDKSGEKELAPVLLELVKKLISRLNEINDGSYIIEDMITEYLESLIK